MSLRPEVERQCLRCGHKWWAERFYGRPDTSWMLGMALYGVGGIARQASKQDKLRRWERYAHCEKCGTKKVRDVQPTVEDKINAFYAKADAWNAAQKEKNKAEWRKLLGRNK